MSQTVKTISNDESIIQRSLRHLGEGVSPSDSHLSEAPWETIESATQEAAKQFSTLANVLRKFGEEPQAAAHFLIRLLFSLFAEDIGLLPEKLFPRLLSRRAATQRILPSVRLT